jgi:hypothetical protein
MKADLTPTQIVEAVKQLSLTDLETVTDQVILIRAQRKVPHLSRRETELLQQINLGMPQTIWQSYRPLKEKLEAENLTEEEHAELIRLIDEIEAYNVERLNWLIELAQLRNQSVRVLMDELGIHPADA